MDEIEYQDKLIEFFIKKNSIPINVVYDIGAYNGEWINNYSKIFKNAKCFLFEANEHHKDELNKTPHKAYCVLLSDEEKEISFYSKNNTGDSYYREMTGFYDKDIPKVIMSQKLDNFCLKNNIPDADFIKIDTQGSELDILRGGINALSKAKIVLLECPVLKYNLGAPKFDDYIDFMESNNFYPSDIIQRHFLDFKLIQMDIMFVRYDVRSKVVVY